MHALIEIRSLLTLKLEILISDLIPLHFTS